MPYADPERQKQYYRDRAERRKNDPDYIEARNSRQRQRYAEDPQGRRDYYNDWRRERRANDPEWQAKEKAWSLESGRKWRGLRWTPEEKAAFEALIACEVCGKKTDKLKADHCHGCGAYRGGLCGPCNFAEGYLRKWQAVCPEGSPMRLYMDQHVCVEQAAA